METVKTNISVELNGQELAMLKRIVKEGGFEPGLASDEEQDVYFSLLEKAHNYEEETDRIDERIDYTPSGSLFIWFWEKVIRPQIKK